MTKSEIKEKILGFLFFERWHPEVSLRYLPLIDEIKSLGEGNSILDVGSGGLGIAPYLKRVVTGIDVEFHPPFFNQLKRVKGSATHMPFPSKSFDIVLSADTLEHLSFEDRKKAIEEMLRVARFKVLIAVPTGKESQKQDELLDEEYFKLHQKRYHFLEEQIGFVIPEKEDIQKAILGAAKKLNRKISLKIIGNENLKLRYFLMKGWMTKNPFTNFFFRKIMLLFIPIMKQLNSEPTYRSLFFVTIES